MERLKGSRFFFGLDSDIPESKPALWTALEMHRQKLLARHVPVKRGLTFGLFLTLITLSGPCLIHEVFAPDKFTQGQQERRVAPSSVNGLAATLGGVNGLPVRYYETDGGEPLVLLKVVV